MIQRLSDELTKIGFNQELTDIWKQRKDIRNKEEKNLLMIFGSNVNAKGPCCMMPGH